MRIWLDDERPCYAGYDMVCTTAESAIYWVETGHVTAISLDHDLGEEKTGYDVARRIEELAFNGDIPRIAWNVHTANPVGRERMERALSNADGYWRRNESA